MEASAEYTSVNTPATLAINRHAAIGAEHRIAVYVLGTRVLTRASATITTAHTNRNYATVCVIREGGLANQL
jgi:hypothetical protein